MKFFLPLLWLAHCASTPLHENLLKWFTDNGARFLVPIEFVYTQHSGIRSSIASLIPISVVAGSDIDTGGGVVEVVRVPQRWMMSSETASNHETLGPIVRKEETLRGHIPMVLQLLYERRDPGSFWREHLGI